MAFQFKIIQLINKNIHSKNLAEFIDNLQRIVDNLNLVRSMVTLHHLGLKEEEERVVAKLEDREKGLL